MIRRLAVPFVAVAIVATGCSTNLGRAEPVCGDDLVTNAVILQAQSVAGTEYVPCISDLKPGWTYQHLESRSGLSRFWISSDRVGERFLEVTLESSCDISGTVQIDSDDPGVDRYIEGVVEDFHVDVIVVPEGDDGDHQDYAAEIVSAIGATRVRNRLVDASVDGSDAPTSDRISAAIASGNAVIVVGAREYEERTVELHVRNPGQTVTEVTAGIDLDEAIDKIAEHLGPPVYRATWYYTFENGCVTYRFDAAGIGVERIARDVASSLGFTPIAPIREFGGQLGYVLP
jgi:hypothetical protein